MGFYTYCSKCAYVEFLNKHSESAICSKCGQKNPVYKKTERERTTLEYADDLLLRGFSTQRVSEITGLSVREVKRSGAFNPNRGKPPSSKSAPLHAMWWLCNEFNK